MSPARPVDGSGAARSRPDRDWARRSPEIESRGLSVRYGGRAALEDVTLRMASGRITAIVGPSGSGKSSFLASLNRLTDLVPACEVRGDVRIGGVDVRAPGVDLVALRRRVGMIFQRPNPFPLSIRRNIELPLAEHGMRSARRRAEVIEEVLAEVGLIDEVRDRLDSPATSLSGGQQQRLCLARALCLRPEALLLDEPCSALDPLSSGVVEDLVASLRGRFTVVIVTHNLAQARRIADDAALFWAERGAGRLVETGPCERMLTEPCTEIARAYVGGARG